MTTLIMMLKSYHHCHTIVIIVIPLGNIDALFIEIVKHVKLNNKIITVFHNLKNMIRIALWKNYVDLILK